ncbi:MAG: DUF4386 domain-containing protein [Candidatus Eremiobacteraeota bacterium]|nr:DUF4386 domain-containing protein [Candidatus Eremiobacteraeota bacterium]
MKTAISIGDSMRMKARVTGAFWLITIAASFFADMGTRSSLVLSGDASATARSLLVSAQSYRIGVGADLVADAAYIVVTLLLYYLLKPISRSLSLLAAFFSLVGMAIGGVIELGYIAPLLILGNAHYLSVFTPAQLQAMAYLSIKVHGQGFRLSLLFPGFQCLLLGWLIFRSTFLPRTLGVLIAIAGLCLLTESFATILMPALESSISSVLFPLDALGEGALALWLLIIGVNAQKWVARAARSAI